MAFYYQKASVHLDRYLTNYSLGYRNPLLKGRLIFPALPMSSTNDIYRIADRSAFRQPVNTYHAPLAETKGGEATFTSGRISTAPYGWHTLISWDIRDAEDDPRDYERTQQQGALDVLQVDEEKRIADAFFASGKYPAAMRWVHAAGSTQWSDGASNPIKDVTISAKGLIFNQVMKEANTLIVGEDVDMYLRIHPDFLARVEGGATNSNPAIVTDSLIKELFQVENYYVVRSRINVSGEGLADSMSKIWDAQDALLAYVDPAPTKYSPTLGFRAVYKDYETRRWPVNDKRGDKIETHYEQGEFITVASAGVFMGNVVA